MQRLLARLALGIAGVAVLTAATIFVLSEQQLGQRYDVAAADIVAVTDSTSLARGAHLYRTITCVTCHAEDGAGTVYADAGPIGFLAGPNLTSGRGGVAPQRTDSDWVRAIRHGVRRDGTSLLVMPSEVFTHLNDADLAALLGFLRQLPPVDRELEPSRFRWMGRAMLVAGRMNLLVAPKTPSDARRDDVPHAPTVEYGRYLADIAGCHGCHGYGLSGGAVAGPPGLPPASNLTPTGLTGWTADRFIETMRTGRRTDGSSLDAFMPWTEFRHMTDEELTALWMYLQGVAPKAFGGK